MVKKLTRLLVDSEGNFIDVKKRKRNKVKLKPVGYPLALPEPIFWSTVEKRVIENAPGYANAYTISQSSAFSGQTIYAVQYYRIGK